MAYVERIGTREDRKCMYYDLYDDAEHTVLRCQRWHRQRYEMGMGIGVQITKENQVS